jgi:DNA adenine methylase
MIKYRGGKSREIDEMLPYIPHDYDRYIEPFFGGGALYFYLAPKKAVINDLNSKLMAFYQGVRDRYQSLHDELSLLEQEYLTNRSVFENAKRLVPNERAFDPNEGLYYSIRDMYNGNIEPAYSEAAIYCFINKTAYSGMIRYNKSGEYNVPYGRYKNFNTRLITKGHSDLLKTTEILSGDYRTIFSECGANDFVFLDPPYDCVFSDYGNEEIRDGFNEIEHRRLSEAFFKLPCRALMVIGKTSLTHSLYDGSIVHEYEKSYAVNIRNRFKSASKHMLISNY